MPAQAVQLRSDFDAVRLRLLADTTQSGDIRARLLALASIYEGHPRNHVARAAGVTLQTLRTWVIRFNAGGPDALRNNFDLGAIDRQRQRAPAI